MCFVVMQGCGDTEGQPGNRQRMLGEPMSARDAGKPLKLEMVNSYSGQRRQVQ